VFWGDVGVVRYQPCAYIIMHKVNKLNLFIKNDMVISKSFV